METVKTSFNELVSVASTLEGGGDDVCAANIRLWLLANGYRGNILIRPEVVDSLWTGVSDRDTFEKTVLLIEDTLRENVRSIGDIYSETCLMEEMEDIPDWKMTTCLNEGTAFCTEEYTTKDGKQMSVTLVAPSGLAWFESKALDNVFAYTPHTYNITTNALIEHAHGFVPHENIISAWLDAFGFDSGHNIIVTLETPACKNGDDRTPADFQTVLDGVCKDIYGTWLCKAGEGPSVLEVATEAAHSIIRGYDLEEMQINEVHLSQLSQILPHSMRDAESVLVRVWEKDKIAPSVTQQYIRWNGHFFDYVKSRELVKRWTI